MNKPQLPSYKRDITNIILQRLRESAQFIQVITGPRQVGKTTSIRQVLAEVATWQGFSCHYAVADLPSPPDSFWILQQWEQARVSLIQNSNVVLVFDEIQKVDRWSETVKKLWDEDRSFGRALHVILLGSSSLLIQKGLTESLAGRFEHLRCYYWGFEECEKCFGWSLDQYIYFGGYPGAASLVRDEDRWADYIRDSIVETAISRDILLLNPIEKPALLRRLFFLACEYGGQIVSYQKFLGQLTDAGNTVTLAHYQHLLESAYLIAGLSKFSGSRVRMRASSPKWVPLNTALVTALGKRGFADVKGDLDEWGRLLECAVGAHLFGSAARHGLGLYYWREGDHEVDYVLQKGRQIVALEVKSAKRKKAMGGMHAFAKKYSECRPLTVGPTGISFEDFFRMDPLLLFS